MSGGHCHCIILRRANKAVTEYYDHMLKPCGVTVNQFSLLRTLERLGNASVSGLARASGLERSTLVRTLRPLLQSGLIEDTAAAGSRDRNLHLTGAGVRALKAGAPLWEAAQQGIEKKLGPEKLTLLAEIAGELRRL